MHKETIAGFVTGDMDIETDWDSYVRELSKMGLERYLEMTQNMYDRQYKWERRWESSRNAVLANQVLRFRLSTGDFGWNPNLVITACVLERRRAVQ